jgi:hypothetical protein
LTATGPNLIRICLLLVLLCGFGAPSLAAERVAVVPLADLSQGDNGVNLSVTKDLISNLELLGATLVSQDEMGEFLASNRFRGTGYLDAFTIQKMGYDLKCSLVLIGTVTEIGGVDSAFGITLQAYNAETGRAIWAHTSATSLLERIRVLGLGQPEQVSELQGLVFDDLLGSLRKKVSSKIMPLNRLYQLDRFDISPPYAKGGGEVEGVVKIRFIDKQPERIAVETSSGPAYLYRDAAADTYRGRWRAPLEEGAYQVSLLLEWQAQRPAERLANVASYEVITESPQLKLEIKKGVQAGEVIAFRDHLLILPRLARMMPMTRWMLEIKNEDGKVLVREEHEGNLPERMVWDGRDGSHSRLVNGTYEIILHAWDLAGNHSYDARLVALQASALPVTVSTVNEKGKTFLRIESATEKGFPLTSWTLDATSGQGEELLKVEGTDLPVKIELPPLEGEPNFYYNFEGSDFLGNRLHLEKEPINLSGEGTDTKTKKPIKAWVKDF